MRPRDALGRVVSRRQVLQLMMMQRCPGSHVDQEALLAVGGHMVGYERMRDGR